MHTVRTATAAAAAVGRSVGQCLIVLVVRKVHSAVLALCRVLNALCSHTHATRDSFVFLVNIGADL